MPARPRLESKVMLAHTWDASIDPAGWLMSEKYDGIRAEWDGKRLLSRYHNDFDAPSWFTDALPVNAHFDGELWLGRGRFQEMSSVLRHTHDPKWRQVTYVIFDAPIEGGTPFESRLAYAHGLADIVPHAHVLDPVPCRDREHLKEALAIVEKAGGEGLVIRRLASPYVRYRSRDLLKVVSRYRDEAIVIGYEAGRKGGSREGLVGALVCKWKNVEFQIGSGLTAKDCRNPPPVGAMVTFEYKRLTDDGKPYAPSFKGERKGE